jgi:hypothetical protein
MNKLASKPRRDETTYNEDEYARLFGKISGKYNKFHTLNLVEEQHRSELCDNVVFNNIPLRAWIPYPQAFAHLGAVR